MSKILMGGRKRKEADPTAADDTIYIVFAF
jgi:hypothetical protein